MLGINPLKEAIPVASRIEVLNIPSVAPGNPSTRLASCEHISGDLLRVGDSVDGEIQARLRAPCPHCGSVVEVDLLLPEDLRERLMPLIGEQIGIMRLDDDYLVRVSHAPA